MYYMRENYPSLNDGFVLQKLSNHTTDIYLAGSNGTPTEIGMWSVSRSPLPQAQDFSKLTAAGNSSVWLLYTNLNVEVAYTFDCTDENNALLAPFFGGETVKNLFWPYEEYTLTESTKEFYANGSAPFFGCLSAIDMDPYSFKALVPKSLWIEMYPVITSFSPGHDTRILSENASLASTNGSIAIPLEFKFSQNMSCDAVTKGIKITSITEAGVTPSIQASSVSCSQISPPESPAYVGAPGSSWVWRGTLENVFDGAHQLTLTNITNSAGTDSTRVFTPQKNSHAKFRPPIASSYGLEKPTTQLFFHALPMSAPPSSTATMTVSCILLNKLLVPRNSATRPIFNRLSVTGSITQAETSRSMQPCGRALKNRNGSASTSLFNTGLASSVPATMFKRAISIRQAPVDGPTCL